MGMKKNEIDAKYDEIIDFAGIHAYIDTPIKRYSSGMRVRLAFSVAAHLNPDILIVDEVLAVGDVEFQKKCLGKIGDVAQSGRTVFFVSHDLNAVMSLCNRVIWIDKGKLMNDGEPKKVIQSYIDSASKISPSVGAPKAPGCRGVPRSTPRNTRRQLAQRGRRRRRRPPPAPAARHHARGAAEARGRCGRGGGGAGGGGRRRRHEGRRDGAHHGLRAGARVGGSVHAAAAASARAGELAPQSTSATCSAGC